MRVVGTVVDMRIRNLRAAVGLVVIALSGCAGGEAVPTLPPTPTSSPIFASEEEALAAAKEAYAAYLEMSNLISSEGGVDPERIAAVARGELYEAALLGFETLRADGLRFVGTSEIRATELQYALLETLEPNHVVAAYICVDVSALDVVNEAGDSVVSSARPDFQAFEVFFDLTDEGRLSPSSREPWESKSLCGG